MTSARPSPTASRPSATPHIAVLEDDAELREAILLPGLRDFGFDVCGAGTAAELYRHMLSQRFDIVVLDIGLPHEDGFSVAQRLRASSSVGIVMLTGHTTSSERIRGLSESADAYLSKPVVLGELAATLHSLARRLRPSASEQAPGHWRLDTDGWCLRSPADHSIALTQAERCILTLLMESPGTPVKRETLIATLTDNSYDFDPHRLEMLVHRLRGKIADGSGEALPLRAVRGTGYVMLR